DDTEKKTILNEEEKKKDDPIKYLKKYHELYYPLQITAMASAGLLIELFVYYGLRNIYISGAPTILLGIFILSLTLVLLASASFFNQNQEIQGFKILGYFFKAGQWMAFFCGSSVVIKYLGYGQIEYWLGYLAVIFLVIIFFEIFICGIARLVDGKVNQNIELKLLILPALLSGGNPINKLLVSIEENIGISLRSTWTLNFIRRNIFFIAFIITVFFWLMTSLVQVNPEEQGIIYSLGKIEHQNPMLPGIHFKLPWPIQTVKIYPFYKINNFTVGYESNQQGDFLWTKSHSGKEYKLLLGDGKEMVCINMQVSYKIGDLYEYILQYDDPAKKLKAEAYRILLNETVSTNLDKLLSRDRSSFSKMVTQKLQQTSKQQKLGLEVMNAALISIHPPTEIAWEYQQIVSATIQKQNIITKAKAYADASMPEAEKEKNKMIKTSKVEALTRIGQALSESDAYLYQLRAYQLNTCAYKTWKRLETLENAVKDKKKYLLDQQLNIQKGGFWLDMRSEYSERKKAADDN
ncbi:MAG: SPFH domain-containing protein, partial [Desulfobacteraceae bacterium]